MSSTKTSTNPSAAHLNQVVLRGRLSGVEDPRPLPSGDELIGFRLVVDRPDLDAGRSRVDTIDCQAVRPVARRALARFEVGDLVEVEGALRRRFWQSPGGLASRYAVEATAVRRPAA